MRSAGKAIAHEPAFRRIMSYIAFINGELNWELRFPNYLDRGGWQLAIPKEQVGSQNGRDRVDRSLECGLLLVEARRKRRFRGPAPL